MLSLPVELLFGALSLQKVLLRGGVRGAAGPSLGTFAIHSASCPGRSGFRGGSTEHPPLLFIARMALAVQKQMGMGKNHHGPPMFPFTRVPILGTYF